MKQCPTLHYYSKHCTVITALYYTITEYCTTLQYKVNTEVNWSLLHCEHCTTLHHSTTLQLNWLVRQLVYLLQLLLLQVIPTHNTTPTPTGNSYTYYNDLPSLVGQLALAAGETLEFDSHTEVCTVTTVTTVTSVITVTTVNTINTVTTVNTFTTNTTITTVTTVTTVFTVITLLLYYPHY